MPQIKTLLCCGLATLCSFAAYSQGGLLRGVGNRAAGKFLDKKVDEAVYGDKNTNNATGNNQNGSTSTSGRNKTNSAGQGLVSTPPDVKENLSSAEAAFKAGNYGEVRYSI